MPPPVIKDDSVLIRVEAISIEGGDIVNRRITSPASAFHVGGYQAAGTIEAVGSNVRRLAVGHIGPNLFHQNRTVSWQMSMPRSNSKSSTFRRLREYRMYIITARRITSGDELK